MASSASVIPIPPCMVTSGLRFRSWRFPGAAGGLALVARARRGVDTLVTLFTLDRLTVLLGNYWLLDSLNLKSVFWTNFKMGAQLYVAAFVVFAVAIALPAFRHPVPRSTRRFVVNTAFLVASVAAYLAAMNYTEFLLGGKGSISERPTRSSATTSASTPSTCPTSGSAGST